MNGINHVLIYHKGTLALLEKNADGLLTEISQATTPALEEPYNLVKSIAHLSVWINVLLQSIINKKEQTPIHQTDLVRIQAHLNLLKKCEIKLVKDEYEVINSLNQLIDCVLSATSIDVIKSLQKQYLIRMAEINSEYSKRATELQLNGMHHIMSTWFERHKLDLGTTRVLIVCAHGPKRDLIEKQYFLNLYTKHGVLEAEELKGYIIPVTMLDEQIADVSQQQLLDFLKKYQMNSLIGEAMLGDPMAMTRDVLAPFAAPVLQKQGCPLHMLDSLKKLSLFAPSKETSSLERTSNSLTKK